MLDRKEKYKKIRKKLRAENAEAAKWVANHVGDRRVDAITITINEDGDVVFNMHCEWETKSMPTTALTPLFERFLLLEKQHVVEQFEALLMKRLKRMRR